MGIMSKKLDDNELDSVSGGAGSNNGMVEADGVVVGLASNGVFPVKTDDGRTVAVRLSGLLRMNFIKIMPGDRVRVEFSTDTMKGRITYPYRNK